MTEEANTCIEILRKAAQFGLIDCQCCPAYPMCPTGTVGWNNECMFDTAANIIESLSTQLEQVTRERDAAIADIKELCMKHSYSMCHYCKYYSDDECEHTDCLTYNSMDAWQWRGCKDER